MLQVYVLLRSKQTFHRATHLTWKSCCTDVYKQMKLCRRSAVHIHTISQYGCIISQVWLICSFCFLCNCCDSVCFPLTHLLGLVVAVVLQKRASKVRPVALGFESLLEPHDSLVFFLRGMTGPQDHTTLLSFSLHGLHRLFLLFCCCLRLA